MNYGPITSHNSCAVKKVKELLAEWVNVFLHSRSMDITKAREILKTKKIYEKYQNKFGLALV